MSGGITVKEFKHIPGVNDAEYIKKLEELHEIDKGIISKAVAKIKMLSAQLNHNAEVSKMGIVHCEDCEHWDTSWETVYGLHYCPMIDMATEKNFFCKYGTEKRGGDEDETD